MSNYIQGLGASDADELARLLSRYPSINVRGIIGGTSTKLKIARAMATAIDKKKRDDDALTNLLRKYPSITKAVKAVPPSRRLQLAQSLGRKIEADAAKARETRRRRFAAQRDDHTAQCRATGMPPNLISACVRNLAAGKGMQQVMDELQASVPGVTEDAPKSKILLYGGAAAAGLVLLLLLRKK